MIETPNFWLVERALSEAYEFTQDLHEEIRRKLRLTDEEIGRFSRLQDLTKISVLADIDPQINRGRYSARFNPTQTYAGNGFGIFLERLPHVTSSEISIPIRLLLVTEPNDFSKTIMVAETWEPSKADVTYRAMILQGNRIGQIAQRTRRNLLFAGPASVSPNLITPEQAITLCFNWRLDGRLSNWALLLTLEGEELEDEVHLAMSSHGPIFTVGLYVPDYHLPKDVRDIDMAEAIGNILKGKPALVEATYKA